MLMGRQIMLVINAGMYQAGTSPVIDEAINKHEEIEDFLKQEEYEPSTIKETLDMLSSLTGIEIPEEEYSECPNSGAKSAAQLSDEKIRSQKEGLAGLQALQGGAAQGLHGNEELLAQKVDTVIPEKEQASL